MKKRGAIGNAIATRKEEFIHEAGRKKKSNRPEQFDIRKISNTVTICPTQGGNERVGLMAHNELEGELIAETGYSKFLNMMNEKKLTTAEQAKKEEIVTSLKPKYGKTSKTYAIATSVAKKVAEENTCDSSKPEKDMRGDYAEKNNIKNRLRSALGVKNPIVITPSEEKYSPEEVELEGEMIDERRREEKGTPRKPRDRAFELVAKSMGSTRLGVQPRGETRLQRQENERTEDPKTGEKLRKRPASAGPTPADRVEKNRASRKSGDEFMRDTRGT
jgi:hypothetical protein